MNCHENYPTEQNSLGKYLQVYYHYIIFGATTIYIDNSIVELGLLQYNMLQLQPPREHQKGNIDSKSHQSYLM